MKPRSKISRNRAQNVFEAWILQLKPHSSGDSIYPFYIDSHYGKLLIGFEVADTRTYKLTGAARADWLYMQFDDIARAKHNVNGMNPFSGKWNHQIYLDKTDEGLRYVLGLMQSQGIVTIGE